MVHYNVNDLSKGHKVKKLEDLQPFTVVKNDVMNFPHAKTACDCDSPGRNCHPIMPMYDIFLHIYGVLQWCEYCLSMHWAEREKTLCCTELTRNSVYHSVMVSSSNVVFAFRNSRSVFLSFGVLASAGFVALVSLFPIPPKKLGRSRTMRVCLSHGSVMTRNAPERLSCCVLSRAHQHIHDGEGRKTRETDWEKETGPGRKI